MKRLFSSRARGAVIVATLFALFLSTFVAASAATEEISIWAADMQGAVSDDDANCTANGGDYNFHRRNDPDLPGNIRLQTCRDEMTGYAHGRFSGLEPAITYSWYVEVRAGTPAARMKIAWSTDGFNTADDEQTLLVREGGWTAYYGGQFTGVTEAWVGVRGLIDRDGVDGAAANVPCEDNSSLRVSRVYLTYDAPEESAPLLPEPRTPALSEPEESSLPTPKQQRRAEDSNDSDNDGLTNELEHWLIETFKPVLVFDEDEVQDCLDPTRQTATLYQVTPYKTKERYGKQGAIITIVILYPQDCGGLDVDIFEGHPGDSEALRIFVYQHPIDGKWYIDRLLMKRHYDNWEAYSPDKFTYAADPNTGLRTHPRIYVSWAKHAMYASHDECEDYHLTRSAPDLIPGIDLEDIPLLNQLDQLEWCSGGTEMALFTPPEHNVGERYNQPHLFDRLSDAGSQILTNLFGNEYAWAIVYPPDADTYKGVGTEVEFCGGIATNRKCGGGLNGKWWPPTKPEDLQHQEEELIEPQ